MKNACTHAVAVIGYVYQNGKFLLLKRNAPPKIWAPPGGRLLPNEDPEKGLEREIFEETGLRIKALQPANIWFGELTAGKPLLSIDYLVEVVGGKLRLSAEHSDYVWASVAMLQTGSPVNLNLFPEGFKIADFIHAEKLYHLLYANTQNISEIS
jgi:ADP-ribose pyrophosphatase YjhB (NUDIX family)